jgi:catechol 2,3-dioxygenase-like lactoylglutathione lyase family enzyme
MDAHALDHVALWVADRDPLAEFAYSHLGMHEIERTDDFTLVGADARRGKLTLFAAEGPREQGALVRVVLRVRDFEGALDRLPAGLEIARPRDGLATFDGPEGLGLGLVSATDIDLDYDIDHVVLRVPDPAASRERFATLGFQPDGGRLQVGDKWMELEPGDGARVERPLLNHIALLVDSAGEVQRDAEERGVEIDDVKDAANTLAVFLRGPAGVRIEYVEHKPGFALV